MSHLPPFTPDELALLPPISDEELAWQELLSEYNRLRLQDMAGTYQELADAYKQLDAAAGAMEKKDDEIRNLTGLCLELLNLVNRENDR